MVVDHCEDVVLQLCGAAMSLCIIQCSYFVVQLFSSKVHASLLKIQSCHHLLANLSLYSSPAVKDCTPDSHGGKKNLLGIRITNLRVQDNSKEQNGNSSQSACLYLILKQYYELIFHNAIGLKIATA